MLTETKHLPKVEILMKSAITSMSVPSRSRGLRMAGGYLPA